MPRLIETHKVNGCNEKITLSASDELTLGGAPVLYQVRYGDPVAVVHIPFQNGPVGEVGTNGLTHEVLLSIVADRLEGFQAGPYACEENRIALERVNDALATLKMRTNARLARGVEGTHKV